MDENPVIIDCPKCGFRRSLPASKIPLGPVEATCPDCRHRFIIRSVVAALPPEPAPAIADDPLAEALNEINLSNVDLSSQPPTHASPRTSTWLLVATAGCV